MVKRLTTITIIFCLCIFSIYAGDTIKYASSCSVDLCTLKTVSNENIDDNNTNGTVTNNGTNGNSSGGCADLPLCYNFDTSLNTSICAPEVACSLFDPCTSAKKCASNTSVCILNTCCPDPICMPIALTSSCSRYTPMPRKRWSGSICPNATWSQNSTLFISNYVNGSYFTSFGDFVIDTSNNFYINDPSYYRILKFSSKTTSIFTIAAYTNFSEMYQAENIFIDKSGVLYSAESVWSSVNAQQNYRIMKYTMKNGVTTSTVIYGPKICGTNISSLCGSSGLFVDQLGAIYYSDTNNHRILKITPTGSSVTIVAGTSGTYGSLANQLYYPGSIFVDSSGSLYVADQNNYRVMKFTSGNLIGIIIYSFPNWNTPGNVFVDNAGSVYFAANNILYKYIPSLGVTIQAVSQINYSYGANKIRMDSYGNLYTNGNYMSSGIFKYNMTENYC